MQHNDTTPISDSVSSVYLVVTRRHDSDFRAVRPLNEEKVYMDHVWVTDD